MQREIKALFVVILVVVAGINSLHADPSKSVGGDFRLIDHNEQDFELHQLKGQIVLMFFGFTHCPDVCPMEMSTISRTLTSLDSKKVKGLFVTVDPARDTPEKLSQYVSYFHPGIIGLTGSPADIKNVARQYNVRYQKQGSQQGYQGEYSFDHSAEIFVIDERGAISAIAPFGVSVPHLVRLVKRLMPE